jgi:hypothetical protein
MRRLTLDLHAVRIHTGPVGPARPDAVAPSLPSPDDAFEARFPIPAARSAG